MFIIECVYESTQYSTKEQIISWAKAHKKKHKKLPSVHSGKVDGVDEQWVAINNNLSGGYRGLKGKSSLAKLFKKHKL